MTNALTPTDSISQALNEDPSLASPHTRRQYAASLRDFEAWRKGKPVTKSLVESYAVSLQRGGLAPATIKQRMSAVLWMTRRSLDLADEHDNPKAAKQAARVLSIKVSKIVKGTTPPAGRHMDEKELAALLRACRDGTPAGVRDTALFALSWTTGLRRAELCGLRLEDIERGENEATLTVTHGKGDKARPAYVYNGAYTALQAWLSVRGESDGFLFCPVRKNGAVAPCQGISGEALRKIERKRELQAGVEHFTSHDLRRSFCGNLLEDNDLATVQALMGHASPVTTSRYDRRPEAVRRAAVQNIHIPEIGE